MEDNPNEQNEKSVKDSQQDNKVLKHKKKIKKLYKFSVDIEEEPKEINNYENSCQKAFHKEANNLFKHKKIRRASSMEKFFIGDHIGITESQNLQTNYQKEEILFAARARRFYAYSHLIESIILVTNQNIYILNNRMETFAETFPIIIKNIEKISLSNESDNTVVIHLGEYKSELLITPYKVELVYIISCRFEELTGKKLDIHFSNTIEFPVNMETMLEVEFVPTSEGVRTTLYYKANS